MRFRFNRDTTAKDQQRTLGQLQMLQGQSAGPPFIADGQARCGKERVIVGQGGKPTVRLRQTAEELRYTGRSEGARRLIFVDHIGLLSIAM